VVQENRVRALSLKSRHSGIFATFLRLILEMIKAIPLEKKYLIQASHLANTIFPNEKVSPGEAFEASLDKDKLKTFIKLNNDHNDIVTLEYFLALDNKENILGTSGLYSQKSDEKDSYWLGWYCVDEKYRGKGVGKLLLEIAMSEAKNRGKRFLKLYTSTDPNEAKAQIIYEKNGFFITNQEKIKEGEFEIFFRKKEL